MYSALTVAGYIIKRCGDICSPVSNLKLQKLLYFVQAEFLVGTGEACFPEDIEAWDFGPVVPVVYHKYKVYGSANIPYTSRGRRISVAGKNMERMNGIIDECSKYSASQLVEITHHQAPWVDAYNPYQRNVITKDSIKLYFQEG